MICTAGFHLPGHGLKKTDVRHGIRRHDRRRFKIKASGFDTQSTGLVDKLVLKSKNYFRNMLHINKWEVLFDIGQLDTSLFVYIDIRQTIGHK